MEVLGADPPSDFEALGLWAAALVNELPPLSAVRDIRLHVLRETDSLRRMHLVQAVIHACLDELDAAGARLKEALEAGAPREGLPERFPKLAREARFEQLFE